MDIAEATLIDLFSGCGGLGLGMHQSGFRTVLANELHPDPASTYINNLISKNPEIMKIGPIQELLKDDFLDEWMTKNDYDVDCIAGGPPCQGFSVAGKGQSDDHRNTLIHEFLRVVRKIRPKTIIFENVPGFANRYGLGLRDYLHNSLESENYTICSGILKARDFGVPQLRKRFIAIGIRNDVLGERKLDLPEPTHSIQRQEKELTTEMIIGDLDTYKNRGGYGSGTIHGDWEYNTVAKSQFQKEMREITGVGKNGSTWNTKIPKHQERVINRMGEILSGKKKEDFIGTKLESAKHSQRALHRDRVPNITILSTPDDYVHYNKDLPRTLSVRECARFQTFPDDFFFYGKRTSGGERRKFDVPQYTQVANAIPPKLGNIIGNHIINFL
jgi:DNA (cytosine-5)-methyltransferase 1